VVGEVWRRRIAARARAADDARAAERLDPTHAAGDRRSLVERLRFRKGGEFRDRIELAEQLADDFARILAAAERFHLLQDAPERGFGLLDGNFRIVLAVCFEALMMFLKFLAEEIRETLAWRTVERPDRTGHPDIRKAAL
jgi:hypothetical protein